MINENTYDVIVIGSGISGGWAAKEFCEQGLRTLVLERGRLINYLDEFSTLTNKPVNIEAVSQVDSENSIVKKCYAYDAESKLFFVKDNEHEYIQEKPFDWIRGYQEGGKSLTWARQTQRWSKFEFEAPISNDFGIPWPINYDDISPWYSHVEKFVGISGNCDGLETLPDSESLKALKMNCVESYLQKHIRTNFLDRDVIMGRCAYLTKPKEIHYEQGRTKGNYFSSNSSTLPWARKTGNLTLKTNTVVHSIIYDDINKKAIGVRTIDEMSKQEINFYSRIIFVNASTINTNVILLNSTSNRFPHGLGNDNGLLGKFIAFHNYRGRIKADLNKYSKYFDLGKRPTMLLIPSFRNVKRQDMGFKRGYLIAFRAIRNKIQPWTIHMMMQGETIPKKENHIRLSKTRTDLWGIPQVITSIAYDENDELTIKDFFEQGTKMLESAGCFNIKTLDTKQSPGLDIHEMGGVRMGDNPKTSLLNKWNQLHECKNVFVTDGACMTSTGSQNPSLTYMALTARASNYAIEEFFKNSN